MTKETKHADNSQKSLTAFKRPPQTHRDNHADTGEAANHNTKLKQTTSDNQTTTVTPVINTTALPATSTSITKSNHNSGEDNNNGDTNHCLKPKPKNYELSEMFLKLAKLHQDCPLLGKLDEWKAYCFHLVAGRLRHLPFDIVGDGGENDNDDDDIRLKQEMAIRQLSQIRGIGKSSVEKIQEYIRTGTISRIREFQCDPNRLAMKNMMNIWGIGSVLAYQLVQQGYTNIKQVRKAINSNELILERNQLIGVDIYEDILEKMTREEVEQIATIISNVVQQKFEQLNRKLHGHRRQKRKRYPEQEHEVSKLTPTDEYGDDHDKEEPATTMIHPPEITIMGSYRRGKSGCGDVDVLITSKEYFDTVHPTILGEIVDHLHECGHIAYHLTVINGMKGFHADNNNNNSMNDRNTRKDDNASTTDYNSSSDDEKDDDDWGKFSSSSQSNRYLSQSQGSWMKRRVKERRELQQNIRWQVPSKGGGPAPIGSCSSYMGVFLSPNAGKRRRVDIKFYPARQKVFATLYFTGNGHFNRSMRLWSKRKFNYTLNDKGLFQGMANRRSNRNSIFYQHGDPVKIKIKKRDFCDESKIKRGNNDENNNNIIHTTTARTKSTTEDVVKGRRAKKLAIPTPNFLGMNASYSEDVQGNSQRSTNNDNSSECVRGEQYIEIPVVQTEKQIFDFLQLEYKEPWERDCFDAVVGKNQSFDTVTRNSSAAMSESDFYQDSARHKWID